MDKMKYIDKIILSLVSLKYFCHKNEKLENIDDLQYLNLETLK